MAPPFHFQITRRDTSVPVSRILTLPFAMVHARGVAAHTATSAVTDAVGVCVGVEVGVAVIGSEAGAGNGALGGSGPLGDGVSVDGGVAVGKGMSAMNRPCDRGSSPTGIVSTTVSVATAITDTVSLNLLTR